MGIVMMMVIIGVARSQSYDDSNDVYCVQLILPTVTLIRKAAASLVQALSFALARPAASPAT
jgi:hypothetical protein